MSGTEIMAVVGFFVMLFGVLFGVWKYIDSKLCKLRDDMGAGQLRYEASLSIATTETARVSRDLAEYKTHAAETYATKEGMQKQTDQLLRAIESIGSRIDYISERIDRAFERPPPRSR